MGLDLVLRLLLLGLLLFGASFVGAEPSAPPSPLAVSAESLPR